MHLTIENQNYYVYWRHLREDRRCECTLLNTTDVDNKTTLSVGMALQGKKELQYVKETARKVSLKRALDILPAETRTMFWNAYFNRKQVLPVQQQIINNTI